jgi:hypothetical protein
VKINEIEIKEVYKFVYLGSVVDKNGKIQNKKNEGTRKASKCHHQLRVYYGIKI